MTAAALPAAEGRVSATREDEGLVVRVDAVRNWGFAVFGVLWIVVAALAVVSGGGSTGLQIVILIFGIVVIPPSVAWSFAGREELVAGDRDLVIRRVLGPWRREERFGRLSVKDVHVVADAPVPPRLLRVSTPWGSKRSGLVAVSAADAEHRVGDYLDEPEAREIVRLLTAEGIGA